MSNNAASKQAILAALGRSALNQSNLKPDLSVLESTALSQLDLINRFEKGLASVTGELIYSDSGNSIDILKCDIAQLINQGMQVISLVGGIEGNQLMPTKPHELKHIDYAIIQARFAVAENGAIWVDSEQLNGINTQTHRVLPFICENLIMVLNKDNIVATMHDAPAKMQLNIGDFGTFIAGPSKTADIEQALVVGAHGAFSLKVYLI
jgi:L-lactate dehydrogenase complex protein LldG